MDFDKIKKSNKLYFASQLVLSNKTKINSFYRQIMPASVQTTSAYPP